MDTSDPKIAEDKARPFITLWKREFRELLAQPHTAASVNDAPTLGELKEAAVIAGHDMALREMDEGRQTLKRSDAAMWRANVRYYEALRDERARDVATGNTDAIEELADQVIEAMGWPVAKGSPLYDQFCELLNKTSLAALAVATRRNAGDVEAESDSKLVREVRDQQAITAAPGETMLDLFDLWAREMLGKGEKRKDTLDQDRKVIEQFAGFVGANRAIETVTPIEVAEYRDTLRRLPPKWSSNGQLRGMSMREAAKKARELELPEMAYTTINKHLSTISPLYGWLAAQPRWAGLRNPVDGLFYKKVKGKNPRPPFTTKQLNKILASPLFTGFEADGKEATRGECQADDWRKWVPLVCLFAGARIGEIAQLRVGDVNQQSGAWFVHIRHEAKAGLSTKSGKSRFAPVHSELECGGFLEFHKRRLAAVGGHLDAPLFESLKPNARGQIGGMPSRWWRNYLKAIGIKDTKDADGFGAHSFRHGLADRFRVEAGLLDNEIAVCLGHSIATTTAGYGTIPQGTAEMLKRYFEGVRFEGVDFSPIRQMSADDKR